LNRSAFKPLIVLLVMMLVLFSAGLPSAHGSTPIVFDATANGAMVGSALTFSWSHTVGSGANRILVVGVASRAVAVAGITYGGTPLAFIAGQNDPSDFSRAEMWYLLSPPSGTAIVQVTFTNPGAPLPYALGGSVSYFNVAGVGNFNSANGASSLASVMVNADSGDLVVDTLAGAAGSLPSAPSAGVGQTVRWSVQSAVFPNDFSAGSDKAAASPVTMTWSIGGSRPTWALIGADLQPVTQPAVHPLNVGGEMLPVNMLRVVAPWIVAVLALTMVAVETLVIRRKKSRKA